MTVLGVDQLQVGVVPHGGWRGVIDAALVEDLEALEVSSLWAAGHVAIGREVPEAMMGLARLATLSHRATVGTAILLLPLYHPVIVAKQLAELDVATGGRVTVGVGVGGEYPQEFGACQIPLSDRGPALSRQAPKLIGTPVASVWLSKFAPTRRQAPGASLHFTRPWLVVVMWVATGKWSAKEPEAVATVNTTLMMSQSSAVTAPATHCATTMLAPDVKPLPFTATTCPSVSPVLGCTLTCSTLSAADAFDTGTSSTTAATMSPTSCFFTILPPSARRVRLPGCRVFHASTLTAMDV